MVDADDLHAALVTLIDSVSGLTSSPVAFDAQTIPTTGQGLTSAAGWFILRPDGEVEPAGPDGGGGGVVRFGFTVLMLWNVATQPNASIQAALACAQAVRAKLHDEAISTTDARIETGGVVIDYPSTQFAVLSFPAVATGYRTTI